MNEIHPRLKNLCITETQKENIEKRNRRLSADAVKHRHAVEAHQAKLAAKRDNLDILDPGTFESIFCSLEG